MENEVFAKKTGGQYESIQAEEIKGDFRDYERIFFQRGETGALDSLLLFSKKGQRLMNLNLDDKRLKEVELGTNTTYQQLEVYDKKIFCIHRDPLTLDIFFLSKKQNMYHRRTIHFANLDMQVKEEFRFLVWKPGTEAVYCCLLGPLEDGRYMNFELPERYLGYNAEDQVISRIAKIILTADDYQDMSCDVICAVEEASQSIICFDRDQYKFFEYNGFAGENSRYLQIALMGGLGDREVKRIYLYYAYDFFPDKVKKQLIAQAKRNRKDQGDLEAFVRNKYKEVLLCMSGGSLFKVSMVSGLPVPQAKYIWNVGVVDPRSGYSPVDIAINKNTGEIYCLGEEKIRILDGSGRKPELDQQQNLNSVMEKNYMS